ncbi:hypothetical protein ACS0TY_029443 [Phlomoides rotata]
MAYSLPYTITQVASFNYTHLESHAVNINCNLLILINDLRNYPMKIPCIDVIRVCSVFQLDSSVGLQHQHAATFREETLHSMEGKLLPVISHQQKRFMPRTRETFPWRSQK